MRRKRVGFYLEGQLGSLRDALHILKNAQSKDNGTMSMVIASIRPPNDANVAVPDCLDFPDVANAVGEIIYRREYGMNQGHQILRRNLRGQFGKTRHILSCKNNVSDSEVLWLSVTAICVQ